MVQKTLHLMFLSKTERIREKKSCKQFRKDFVFSCDFALTKICRFITQKNHTLLIHIESFNYRTKNSIRVRKCACFTQYIRWVRCCSAFNLITYQQSKTNRTWTFRNIFNRNQLILIIARGMKHSSNVSNDTNQSKPKYDLRSLVLAIVNAELYHEGVKSQRLPINIKMEFN